MSADKKTKDPFNAWLVGLLLLSGVIVFFSEAMKGGEVSLLDLALKTGALTLFGTIAAMSYHSLSSAKRNTYTIKLELALLEAEKTIDVLKTPFRDRMSSMRGFVELDDVLFDRKSDPERAFVDGKWISFPTSGAPWSSVLEGEPLTEEAARDRFPAAF